MGDIKGELSETVRNNRQNQPMQSSQMGILQLLKENNIDYSKYKLTKSAQEILTDLDWRIADIVKQADLTKHEVQLVKLHEFFTRISFFFTFERILLLR